MNGAEFGGALALLAFLLSGYEFVAILSPRLPTISRVLQGWRDRGGARWVLVIAVGCAISLGVFAAWLVKHLTRERRSDL